MHPDIAVEESLLVHLLLENVAVEMEMAIQIDPENHLLLAAAVVVAVLVGLEIFEENFFINFF